MFERYKDNFLLSGQFYLFLTLKLGAGITLGLIYKHHYGGGDTFGLFNDALTVTNVSFAEAAHFLIHGEWLSSTSLLYIHQYKALFFVRLITLPLWLCAGSYWGLTLVLSLFSFWSIWLLSNQLVNQFKIDERAVLYSLMYFPEVLFWSSGVMKETLTFSFQCLSILFLLFLLNKKNKLLSVILLVFTSYLLFRLKFYIAATFIPALLAYGIAFYIPNWKKITFISSYVVLLVLATFVHPVLSLTTLVHEVYLNMLETIRISDAGKTIPFHFFDGTILGLLLETANALFSALFRPFLWESKNGLMMVISWLRVEFLLGVIMAMYWCKQLKLEGLVLVTYALCSVTLLALASPNYGTLSRYMIAATPFLVLVILVILLPHLDEWMKMKHNNDKE